MSKMLVIDCCADCCYCTPQNEYGKPYYCQLLREYMPGVAIAAEICEDCTLPDAGPEGAA
jgi:hypothetical protein